MSEVMLFSMFQIGKIIIPLYQRNYDWKRQNCKQLLDDIERLAKDSDSSKKHFTGAIIYTNDGLSHVIIDGQQRITTVQLLLLALRDLISSGELTITDSDNASLIRLLIGKKEKVLELCGNDDVAFKSLFDGKWNDDWSKEEYGSTNIWKNYNYLKDELRKIDYVNDVGDKMIDAIQRLWVVPIELKEKDDPQAVFESINTTGVKLSDSDRIRNYMMMNHSKDIQKKIYDEYWKVIEKELGDDAIEQFFVDYLKSVTFTKVQTSNNGAYQTFKKQFSRVKEEGPEKWAVFDHIRDSAKLYHNILTNTIADYSSSEASRAIRYINHMELKVCYPFILNLLNAQKSNELSKEAVANSILIIETYLERRQAAKFPTNALNSMFFSLYKSVSNLPGDAPFDDKLAYYLNTKTNNLKNPSDEDIKAVLPTRDIYNTRKDCEVILAIADYVNRDSPEILDKVGKEEGYTIDHVLPQNPNETWYSEYPNLDDVKKKYLNTIGNLTFTTYNSNFGNESFQYRLNVETIGYKNSPLHINEYLKKQTKWSEEQIVTRANIIVNDFLTNRPIISSNGYSPRNDDEIEISLDEDLDVLTNTTILGYRFADEQFVQTGNAVKTYLSILRRLCSDYPDQFAEWAESPVTTGYASCIHTKQNDEGSYGELASGIFIWKSMSNHDKFNILKKIMEDLEVDTHELFIRYKEKKNGSREM